jgi:hypothetical protein
VTDVTERINPEEDVIDRKTTLEPATDYHNIEEGSATLEETTEYNAAEEASTTASDITVITTEDGEITTREPLEISTTVTLVDIIQNPGKEQFVLTPENEHIVSSASKERSGDTTFEEMITIMHTTTESINILEPEDLHGASGNESPRHNAQGTQNLKAHVISFTQTPVDPDKTFEKDERIPSGKREITL